MRSCTLPLADQLHCFINGGAKAGIAAGRRWVKAIDGDRPKNLPLQRQKRTLITTRQA
jgi:hypothetical protein